jgi:hypothetical protein
VSDFSGYALFLVHRCCRVCPSPSAPRAKIETAVSIPQSGLDVRAWQMRGVLPQESQVRAWLAPRQERRRSGREIDRPSAADRAASSRLGRGPGSQQTRIGSARLRISWKVTITSTLGRNCFATDVLKAA